jgi:hypothetical protein
MSEHLAKITKSQAGDYVFKLPRDVDGDGKDDHVAVKVREGLATSDQYQLEVGNKTLYIANVEWKLSSTSGDRYPRYTRVGISEQYQTNSGRVVKAGQPGYVNILGGLLCHQREGYEYSFFSFHLKTDDDLIKYYVTATTTNPSDRGVDYGRQDVREGCLEKAVTVASTK